MPWQLPLVAAGSPEATLTARQDGATIRRSVLPGGVRVLTEYVPSVRSVTLGLWVPVGSRDETKGHFGSTHFLEHLLFKGTATRTAAEIAASFDEVGGESNAATAKEHTCYYARVLDSDLDMAVGVLTDMITGAVIDPGEFDTERQVILEELAMNEDDAADVVHERFAEHTLRPTSLARPIGCTRETITAVQRDDVWEHYVAHYRPHNLIVTAAGNVDHDQLCDLVLHGLSAGGWQLDEKTQPSARRASSAALPPATEARVQLAKPGEQAHLIVGSPGIVAGDPRRFTMSMLCTILGGGLSSRLFQEIRERRGLAYSVYAFSSSYSDDGSFGMYAGCAPRNVAEVEQRMADELRALARGEIDADELRRAQGQLTGGLVLGLEDTASRMSRLGRAEISIGELYSIDDSLAAMRAVTLDDIVALADQLASTPLTTVSVQP
ncbi:pitrilysin family protein [Rarobacter faecitabidus]|uniref:Putative Zn-dependent peptidase n=1 Tax=Rarobacter faecitabidus TaxID=13243 RepID=A0A542ZWC5_RARFA|nr:pitrilysin family protein [Rarobacter faecitabidus]TQL64665.1 putative Zn-dependent peptidase [Rarobacter faecitabidus]